MPEATAVGGTTFNEGSGRYWASTNDANGASALSYIPEVVLERYAEHRRRAAPPAAVASAFFGKPYWQVGPGSAERQSARHS